MTQDETRQALATAASTVDGVTVSKYFVQNTRQGSGMIRLDRIEYPNKFGGVCHWNVIIMLDQNMAKAEEFLGNHLDDLEAALKLELAITSIQPQRIDLPGVGIQPCVFINGHREKG